MEPEERNGRLNLNLGWKFRQGEAPSAWQTDYDDGDWETVDLPHDWSVRQAFDIGCSSGTGYLPGGIGTYRKTFGLPPSAVGKAVAITFDGVYKNAMIWCNGYYLGKRPYGYSRFSFDLSEIVRTGKDANVVTVRVDHRDIADSRWYTGSGIYRKVTLTVKERIRIPDGGVFVFTETADARAATIRVKTDVLNASGNDEDILIRQTLADPLGNVAASAELPETVRAGERISVDRTLTVSRPELWSPDSPALYACVTEILLDGAAIDRERTVTGIRTFRFDPDAGFSLNGASMKLKGVCVHHDAGCLGAAVRPKVWKRRLLKLKEMGCNAIRMSHNPHMEELYDLCDELGFFVMDEAFDEWEGVKNKWSRGHNVYPPVHFGYYEEFPRWHEADLTSMVVSHRNHPSIILWSIGNEVDYPNDPYCHPFFSSMTGNNDANKPAAELKYNPAKPNAERLTVVSKELVSIVKKHDETRPVTAALAFPELSNLTGFSDTLDVAGYNYKEHLYDADHARYPDRVILGSENGRELVQWRTVADRPFISGQFLWTGIDFLGETKLWPCHGSEAGHLDVAGFEKPIFWFRKSLWSDEPVLRLFTACEEAAGGTRWDLFNRELSRSWNYLPGEPVRVVCFTNCGSVELFLNGKRFGAGKAGDPAEGYLSWTVPFEAGELSAAGGSGKQAGDSLSTVSAPAGIRLRAEDAILFADGLDMTHIEVEVIDHVGRIVPSAESTIHASVDGPGTLLGLENGNLYDTQPYSLPYRRARNGRLLAYVASRPEAGKIAVRFHAERLGTATVAIECVPASGTRAAGKTRAAISG